MATQEKPTDSFFKSNLFIRICSAVVLAPIVIVAELIGGGLFLGLVLIISAAVCFEWLRMIYPRFQSIPITLILLLILFSLYLFATVPAATAWVPIGLLWVGLTIAGYSSGMGIWLGAGFLYSFMLGAALLIMRGDLEYGAAAIGLVVAVVWTTDTFAYFFGRAIGGPKLWPAVSPGKTWSGAIGGLCAGILACVAFWAFIDGLSVFRLMVMGFILSVASQCGDLFESWIKRRFNAKDSGNLIPGHGGVMDRVDGLVFAVVVSVLISFLADAKLSEPARALFFGSV